MKKSVTGLNPLDKAETIKSDVHIRQITIQKLFRDHKFSDHSHGRVNKHPLGLNHDPGIY